LFALALPVALMELVSVQGVRAEKYLNT
jgi:hypothetical protein